MTEPDYLPLGTLLRGRYEIVREIGRGGYSVVYLARDREIDADVAVKLLVPPPAAARVARERMRREVQAVRGLSHANIVAVFDFLEEGPWSFIVMEYVAGPDLQVRVRDRGALGGDEAVRLGRDIAAALAAAHRKGILHRDVKPQNILLDPDGRARLTDFGSAKLDGQLGVTATGALAGTLDYTAPEVLAGRRGDARADVYALGLTLYYALTAELPRLPSAQLGPTPSPEGFRPRVSATGVAPWLDAVIAHATTAAPEDRFPTADAFDKALAQEEPTNLPAAKTNAGRCVLCGAPDPLGLALCYACGGGSNGSADTLVFLDPPAGPEQRREAEARLLTLLPGSATGAAQAIRGTRPLFRVSGASAPRVLEELARRRLPARSLAARRPWSRLPAGVFLTVGSVLAGGSITGLMVAPLFLWSTPLFAALLLLSARRELTTPVVVPPPRRADMPPQLEREALDALTRLPDGTARSLLADITRMSDGLFGRLRRSGDIRNLGPALSELLTASCAAAADLSSLDDSLARLERQREKRAELPAGWLDALSRCERSRDALVQRLLEAMTVLGRLQSTTSDGGPDLAEVTQQLQGEASAQAAAVKEIEQLLSPRHN